MPKSVPSLCSISDLNIRLSFTILAVENEYKVLRLILFKSLVVLQNVSKQSQEYMPSVQIPSPTWTVCPFSPSGFNAVILVRLQKDPPSLGYLLGVCGPHHHVV